MRIGYLGAIDGYLKDSYALNSDEIMTESGQNLGNLAFWKSCFNLFENEAVRIKWTDSPIEIKQSIDLLVIPAANFLMENSDLSLLRDLVSYIDKPVVMVGLGAQSENENQIPLLKEGTIDFIKEVSKRTNYIGVRGDFTEKVCRHYGITNIKVMGCPSIFINNNQNLGRLVESKVFQTVERFSTASASIKGNLTTSERILFYLTQELSGKYIIQRPAMFLKILRGEKLTDQDMAYFIKYSEYISPSMPESTFYSIVMEYCKYFTNADSWLEFHRNTTHTINTRIHGTILPLSAGVPSVCVTHDTRTRELSKALKIPTISAHEFSTTFKSVHQIFEQVGFSGEEFDDNRRLLAKLYSDLFNSSGAKVSSKLGYE